MKMVSALHTVNYTKGPYTNMISRMCTDALWTSPPCFAFQLWACTEPDNWNDGQDCINMPNGIYGGWDDTECDKEHHFVCKMASLG